MSNFRNTVTCLNRFIGRSSADSESLNIESSFLTCAVAEKDDEVSAKLQYKGEEKVFSSTELMAMLLGKLKDIAQKELKSAVSDCVISVPEFFGETERRAMLDASAIAGLNCLRLVNDTTAAALCYGLTKNDQFTDSPKTVCLVDIGYSSTKISIVSFTKGHLEVKETHCEPHLGGRDFDEALVQYFSDNIKEMHNVDVIANKRGLLRMRSACEKIKKVLSGIVQTKVELETETRDFPLTMTREHFESLTLPLIQKLKSCLEACLQKSGLSTKDIDSVEIIGGSTRVPAIKNMLSSFFGKDVSTTMNQDEAVARGCAFQCAIESPSFRVREFGVKDIINYPIKLSWSSPEVKEMELFPRGSQLPSVKPVFFNKQVPTDITASFSEDVPPFSSNAFVGSVKIRLPKAFASDAWKVRIDFEINLHGLFNVKKVLLIEELIEEFKNEAEEVQTRKVIREQELQYELSTASRSAKALQLLKDQEFALSLSDRYAQELDDSRNNLEEFIYETRSKLDDKYQPYLGNGVTAKIRQVLEQAEEWLFSPHEVENKEMYQAKLQDLRKIVEPISQQEKNHSLALEYSVYFRHKIEETFDRAQKSSLNTEELAKISELCQIRLKWLNDICSKQEQTPLYETLVLKKSEIVTQQDSFLSAAEAIFQAAAARAAQAPPTPVDEMNTE